MFKCTQARYKLSCNPNECYSVSEQVCVRQVGSKPLRRCDAAKMRGTMYVYMYIYIFISLFIDLSWFYLYIHNYIVIYHSSIVFTFVYKSIELTMGLHLIKVHHGPFMDDSPTVDGCEILQAG